MLDENRDPWYKEGLNFKCTECGKCCTGAPGYVWVLEEELAEMADYLKISLQEFSQKFVRKVNGKLALIEKKRGESYDCVFLKEKKCTIYPVRPKQCRTFPWWQQNLTSREEWNALAKECEGIRADAPLIPISKIRESLA
ncbi:MAG: YkgJ family cysteine cluster protein [Chlamydiales bacterium]|nr:YkgJ family cysteine cluster protein [Chlamydiales bacterium]